MPQEQAAPSRSRFSLASQTVPPQSLETHLSHPVLGRIFSKVLMSRVHRKAPPCSGHQIGCRPGVQAADGIMAAQSTLQLLRQTKQGAYTAKIDIRAAFDSLC